MEQLANLYSSTLALAYVAGSHSMKVVSAVGLPGSGNFALSIIDQTTGLVKLIVEVTSIAGVTLTVTAESADVNCNLGDGIVGTMLTARSVPAILTDWLGYGATSSLPSSAANIGQRFQVSDGNYEYIWNGSIWVPFFDGVQTAIPDNTAFSWINQTGASVAVQTDGSILLTGVANSGSGLQCRNMVAPATPYKFKFVFVPILPDGHFAHAGIFFTDGTKFSEVDLLCDNAVSTTGVWTHLAGAHYTDVNTFDSSLALTFGGSQAPSGQTLVLGLSDDGTDRTFFYYPDGYTEIQLFQETSSTFLTATGIGFFYDDNGANLGGAVMLNGLQQV